MARYLKFDADITIQTEWEGMGPQEDHDVMEYYRVGLENLLKAALYMVDGENKVEVIWDEGT